MKKILIGLLIVMTMLGSAFAAVSGISGSTGTTGSGASTTPPGSIPGTVNSNVNAAPGTLNRQQLDQQTTIHNNRIQNQRMNPGMNTR